jgi:Xaa-Pro aminopeptidase
LDLADELRAAGYALAPRRPFFPDRAVKSAEEIDCIRDCGRLVGAAFDRIEEIIGDSEVRSGRLFFGGKELDSETLKIEAEIALIKNSMIAIEEMIISSGPHSAIPHHNGQGPIRAGEPIICDIYPRHRQTGYHADLSRTYSKGQPSDRLASMYEAVLEAQTEAIRLVKPGAAARDIHQRCIDVFLDKGYHYGDKGFIHATGHGLGLQVHEGPTINSSSADILLPGNVITIEPGLYYPDIGGVRIEDMVLVTESGHEVLTDYPKRFVLE